MTSRALVPSALARQGTGLDAAASGRLAARLLEPPGAACLVCGRAAEPGDDLCARDGGMEDGIARHAAMRAATP